MRQDYIKKLRNVVTIYYGKGLSKSERKEDGAYPVYGANGIVGHTDRWLIDGETVIIGRKGAAGKVLKISGKCWPSDVTYYVQGNDTVNIDYLYYILRGANIEQYARGVKPGINRETLYDIEIPLPPLSEQKRIAVKLDDLMSHIAQAKTLRTEAGADTNQLLPAALHHVFSQAEQNGWEEKTVEEITRTIQYGYTSSAQEEGNAKFLRITDIQHGQVQWSQVPYCDCENIEKYRLFEGDIVFARTGATVGKSFFIENPPQDTVFASYLIRVITQKEQCLPKFLFYFFQSPQYWEQITEYKSGGAQPSVNGKKLKSLRLPLPPLEEQHRLVQYIDTIAEHTRHLQDHQTQTANDLTELEQSLLHKAFDGEV